jgi:hypothetical protein
MLRRDPSHIQLNDSDVQDVRDYLALKKSAANTNTASASASAGASASAAPAPVPMPMPVSGQNQQQQQQPVNAADDARRRREAMSRDQRLGL